MKKLYAGFVSVICGCSLVVNVLLAKAWLSHRHQTHYAEATAMAHVADDINQANAWMPRKMPGKPNTLLIWLARTAAVSRLTEASGALSTLYSVVPASSKETENDLFAVAYYLHFQGTAGSFNGLRPFMSRANRLLESHISNSRYNVAYFSSDMAKLDEMLPRSFR